MTGRYNGVYMKAHTILPGAKRVARILEVSPEATHRLKWLDWYRSHGSNGRLTCRHFGISPDTLYRWRRRYQANNLRSLESHSRCPHHVRMSAFPPETIALVTRLRQTDMAASKYKIRQVLLRDHEVRLSASSIGRMLTRSGLIVQAQQIRSIKRRKRVHYMIPRLRAVVAMRSKAPGYLVQVDTKHLVILGQTYYQFVAVDCFSKLGFSYVYTSGASKNAADFLGRVVAYFPFTIQSIQTDNGGEFLLHFHAACQKLGLTHYFSHPRTPKDNPMVERMIQTAIYELWLFDETLVGEISYLNERLAAWIGRYNTYRPHQALHYLTPMEYLHENGGGVYGMS